MLFVIVWPKKSEIFHADLISRIAKILIFRADLISRTAEFSIFRADLISWKKPKYAKYAKINPIKVYFEYIFSEYNWLELEN